MLTNRSITFFLSLLLVCVSTTSTFLILGIAISDKIPKCESLRRTLSEEEIIKAVISQVAVGDVDLHLQNGSIVTVRREQTVEEFLNRYPECCKLRKDELYYFDRFDFARWLKNERLPLVEITFPRIVPTDGGIIEFDTTTSIVQTDPCGKIINPL